MYRFFKKILKVVKLSVISIFAVCFVCSSKSYSLVDADKVVELLYWAANSDSSVSEDTASNSIVVSIPSLSVSPFSSPSPGLSPGPVFKPMPCLPPVPFVVGSPHVSDSPFVTGSPDLANDYFTICKAKTFDEEMFLGTVYHGYRAFFEDFTRDRVRSRVKQLCGNPRFFQFFKHAVLVRMFENAINKVSFECAEKYRRSWWYRMIFSCDDEEMHYYEEVYSDFKTYRPFRLLMLSSC